MGNFRIYCVTYNVGTSGPEPDLKDFLSLSNDENDENNYDLYVVGLQEVTTAPINRVIDAVFGDTWTYTMKMIFIEKDYMIISGIKTEGMILNVFCHKKHLIHLKQIECLSTKTGFSGLWGNKGAVSVRFNIYGVSLCFVNSHLSAHDHKLKNRIEDYHNIIASQNFHVPESSTILFHDYVFWMGDLNFRFNEDAYKTADEIEKVIKDGDFQTLYENDQLYTAMRRGDAFSQFTEQQPTFPPTFKFVVGTSNYNHKRRPAWCDRILYRVNSNNYPDVSLGVEQKSYKSLPNYLISDHLPVSADFEIKVFPQPEEPIVTFDPIPFWYIEEENSATFQINQPIHCRENDWIGVYSDATAALDEYLTYEYVEASNPLEENEKTSDPSSEPKKTIKFSEVKPFWEYQFRLIYFSLTEDNVQSILGISNRFPLRERPESSEHDSNYETKL